MKVYRVQIQGLPPGLLMNRFSEENEIQVSSGTRAVHKAGNGAPRAEAMQKAYKDTHGRLYLPGPNIFAAIIQAGKYHKAGRNKLTTTKSSLVPGGVTLADLVCPLWAKTNGEWEPAVNFEIDTRRVRIPATGGAVMRHRPRLDSWRTEFSLDVDTAMFAEDLVRALVDDAGKRVGVGDFRPDCKGVFGKFVVTEWGEE